MEVLLQGFVVPHLVLALLEVTVCLHEGHVRGGQISRAAEEAGEHTSQGVEHGLGVQPGGQALVLWRELGQGIHPAGWEIACSNTTR